MGRRFGSAATGNVDPRVTGWRFTRPSSVGDHKRALEAPVPSCALRTAFGLGTFPVVIKEALTMIGIDRRSRHPARRPDDAGKPGEAAPRLRPIWAC